MKRLLDDGFWLVLLAAAGWTCLLIEVLTAATAFMATASMIFLVICFFQTRDSG